ncbi:DUF294 nucleotidyltransferase-like domain-containing protein [Spongiivirga sp. MCCC 1A20706]|uniref:DUF294 nucleotidyltransferase-like domain-containing protein n=1 Tax=Spongiivirga sp. MCCC 1A20706 TaxID=3160963 RepID=UPI00397732F6
MKNTIAERIADNLRRFPPFDLLQKEDLQQISENVKVIYLEKNSNCFKENEVRHEQFYFVKDGAVGLYKKDETTESLVDICDEGDLFGLRPLITKENYQMSARTNEESVLYGIPINIFTPIAEKDKKISNYLIASFASNTRNPIELEKGGKLFTEYKVDRNPDLFELQTASYIKNPICCSPDTPLKEAAIKMRNQRIGSIVVVSNEQIPVGIITNSDIRNKIATGDFSINTAASFIMSSPVITQPSGITIAQAQMIMVRHNIRHICITEDGTAHTKLIGMLTEHDILLSKANNPSVLIKGIRRAKSVKSLREIRLKIGILLKVYIDQNIPLSHVSKIIGELNSLIIDQTISLSVTEMPNEPPVNFAWLALGSQGRREQLIPTDQDNALVFEDVHADKYANTKAYFLELANIITKHLHAIGFEYCKADMMGSNPKWCESLSNWKNQFSNWILKPTEETILLSSIFFDFDLAYGDSKLVDALTESIYKSLEKGDLFCTYMGRDALKNPSPLGFFRQFLVEHDGKNKDTFDIKSRAMMPLIDAARLLTLSQKVKNINNTALRFENLALLEPQNAELYKSCAYSFKALLKFRTKQGIQNNDSGRYIKLSSLSKEDRLKLKRCFKPIKDIQELIKVRFQLASFL